MFNRLKDERGFTLIELLVVVLIIGILAAVALPTFLGQRDKGFDADAKSNARNLQTMVESCGVDNAGDYALCDTAAELTTAGANVARCRSAPAPARSTSPAPARTRTPSRRTRRPSPAPTRRRSPSSRRRRRVTKGGTGTW